MRSAGRVARTHTSLESRQLFGALLLEAPGVAKFEYGESLLGGPKYRQLD